MVGRKALKNGLFVWLGKMSKEKTRKGRKIKGKPADFVFYSTTLHILLYK